MHSERDSEMKSESEPQNAVGRHRSLKMSINRQLTKILTEIRYVDKNTAQDTMGNRPTNICEKPQISMHAKNVNKY